MTGRTFDGRPLTPGVNVDALDLAAGIAKAAELGYMTNGNDRMTVEYALQRHARGEEDGAEKTWLSHFGPPNLTEWRMVLAAAMAGAVPTRETIHVVWQPGYDDDRGQLVAASRDSRIAEAIEKLGYDWFTEEVELVSGLDEIVSVPVYESIGVRTQIGLWNIQHRETPTWKRRVTCGEADLVLGPAPTPGIRRSELVRVIGTDQDKVREAFMREALRIEATYGHDKLRTQVEELDPIERF